MDPITAVGFAASILTFIDFASSMVKGTREIYKSVAGNTVENARISNIIGDLRSAAVDLETDIQGTSNGDKALIQLAGECKNLSDTLLGILRKLKAKDNSSWQSFKAQWRVMRKEKEIASIEERLGEYRSEITLRVQFMLCNQSKMQHSVVKAYLDKIQQDGDRLSKETARRLSELRGDVNRLVQKIQENHDATSVTNDEERSGGGTQLVSDLSESFQKLAISARALSSENSVLRRLYFDSMYEREDSVEKAEQGTFSWIFHPEDSGSSLPKDSMDLEQEWQRKQASDVIVHFLGLGSGVLFICGKAGSGKSTLMKYLGDHSATREHLGSWAAGKRLVFVRAYFWNSGSKLQRSTEGFYRKILFETLQQCPELIGQLFPDSYLESDASKSPHHPRDHGHVSDRSFRLPELKSAVSNLMRPGAFPNHNFCYYIDGLDEYEGNSLEHFGLARDLQSWGKCEGVKIICSARPHQEFLKTFKEQQRTIYIHELTGQDISLFVETGMKRELSNLDAAELFNTYAPLIKEILRKADGVFLWVHLVMLSILNGIAHRLSPKDLMDIIDGCPSDINALYTKMLGNLEAVHRKKSALMLALAAYVPWTEPLFAVEYSWIDQLEDADFPYSIQQKGDHGSEDAECIETIRSQLVFFTKGLLEIRTYHVFDLSPVFIRPWSRVEFLHRTGRDFIRNDCPWVQDLCKIRSDEAFPLLDSYCRLWLAYCIRFGPSNIDTLQKWTLNHPSHLLPRKFLDDMGEQAERLNRPYGNTHKDLFSNELTIPKYFSLLSLKSPRYGPPLEKRYYSYIMEHFVYHGQQHSFNAAHLEFAFSLKQWEYLENRLVVLTNAERAQICSCDLNRWLLLVSENSRCGVELWESLCAAGADPLGNITIKSEFLSGRDTIWLCFPFWLVFLQRLVQEFNERRTTVFNRRRRSLKSFLENDEAFEIDLEPTAFHLKKGTSSSIIFACRRDSGHWFHLTLYEILVIMNSEVASQLCANGILPLTNGQQIWDSTSPRFKAETYRSYVAPLDESYLKTHSWRVCYIAEGAAGARGLSTEFVIPGVFYINHDERLARANRLRYSMLRMA